MYKIHTFYFTLVLALFSINTFGTTYTTTAKNRWTPSTPGRNITTSDDFVINHEATLYGITLASGGSITVNNGGKVSFKWSASFKSGSQVTVNSGGELEIKQVTLTNYSENFVINGELNTASGTLANYSPGAIYYNEGAEWTMNQFTFANYSTLIMNADADWKNSSVAFQAGGAVEINNEIDIKNLTLQNNGEITGYGQITLANGNGTFQSNGTINGCQGSTCIPPSTVGTTTYLYYHTVPGGSGYTPITGGTVSNTTCSDKILILEDTEISADVVVGDVVVSPGVSLVINTDKTLSVCNGIDNEGLVLVKAKGSLVQNSTSDLNTGDGTYTIEIVGSSSPSAYNSWSSPLQAAKINTVFSGANECDIFGFEGVTQSWKYDYPVNYQGDCNGNTVTFSAGIVLPGGDGIMDVGRGYFVPGTSSVTRTVSGKVNNGDVIVDVYSTSLGHNPLWDDDDWNLVGNPYPCAIDLSKFNDENEDDVFGSFYFWVDDNQGGTNYNFSEDYAIYANGVGTTANGGTARQYVAAGQAFWVYAKKNGTVKFTNDMRVTGNNAHLFKRSNDVPSFVYLSVLNDSNNYNQCGIGFNNSATDGFDEKSDGPKGEAGTGVALGSFINGSPYGIQALEQINENESKEVDLFMKSTNAGLHTFSADSFQNMGGEYAVFLKDHISGDITDLKQSDYTVFLDTGNHSSRFSILFENNGTPLSVNENNINTNITAYQMGEEIWVDLNDNTIDFDNVVVFDILGKELLNSSNINGSRIVLDAATLSTGVYVVKTRMSDGSMSSVKIAITK